MKALLTLFCLLFSFYLHANKYEYLANKSYANRQKAFINDFYYNDIFNDSITFFKEVNKLKKVALKYKDNELLLETELMFFNFLSSKKYPYYKEGMKKLIERVDKTGIKHLQARTRQALGLHYYYEEMAYAKALSWLNESMDFLDQLDVKELPDKQELVFNIASVHFNIGYNETSLQYLKIAEKLSNTYYDGLILNIINTKGLIYRAQSNESEMASTFKKLLNLSIEKKNANWVRLAQNHLAEMYRSQGKINEAFNALKGDYFGIKDVEIEKSIYVKRLQIYANLYIESNQQEEAIKTIQMIDPLMVGVENHSLELAYLPLRAYIAGTKGDFNQAYQLIDSALKSTILTSKKRFSSLVKQSESKEEIEKYFRQKAELENEKRLNRVTIISTSIILLLIIIASIIFFQKQRSVYKQKQLKMALEKQQMSEKLKSAQEELNNLTDSLISKNKELVVFREELKKIESSNSKDEHLMQRANILNDLLNKAILTDESWIAFKQAFENVHVGFIDRLNEQMPGLTQAELRYIILQKMNLSGKEIAAILGISFDSIRSYKFRIRKKFHLNQDDEIKNIIDGI